MQHAIPDLVEPVETLRLATGEHFGIHVGQRSDDDGVHGATVATRPSKDNGNAGHITIGKNPVQSLGQPGLMVRLPTAREVSPRLLPAVTVTLRAPTADPANPEVMVPDQLLLPLRVIVKDAPAPDTMATAKSASRIRAWTTTEYGQPPVVYTVGVPENATESMIGRGRAGGRVVVGTLGGRVVGTAVGRGGMVPPCGGAVVAGSPGVVVEVVEELVLVTGGPRP